MTIHEYTTWKRATGWIFTTDGHMRYKEWCEMEGRRIEGETGRRCFVKTRTVKEKRGKSYEVCCLVGEWEEPDYDR